MILLGEISVNYIKGKNLKYYMIPIENLMSKPVITVKPEDSIYTAVRKMVNKNIGAVVVINKDKSLAGILTERDVLKRIVIKKREIKETKVKDVMTKKIQTATTNSTVLEISKLMENGHLRRIPVISNNKVTGIITARDIIKFMSL